MKTWTQIRRQRYVSPAKRNPLAYNARKLLVVLMLLTSLLSGSRLALAQNANSYIVTPLNSPVPLSGSAINDLGWVIGNSRAGTNEAAIWIPTQSNGTTGSVTILGSNPSSAYGLNNNGQVVGTALNGYGSNVLWTVNANGSFTTEALPGLWAYSINDSGQVAGQWTGPNNAQDAWLWQNGTSYDLGSLGDGYYSWAQRINSSGLAAGTSQGPYGPSDWSVYPCLWTPGAGIQSLGLLPNNNGIVYVGGEASAINDLGEVIGVCSPVLHEFGLSVDEGFLWTSSGGMLDLGTFIGGANTPTGINDAGDIIFSYPAPYLLHFNTTTQQYVLFNLNTLLGYTNLSPVAINNKGQIVADASVGYSYLLTPNIVLKSVTGGTQPGGAASSKLSIDFPVLVDTPADLSLSVPANAPAASVPNSVTVSSGQTAVTFPVTAPQVSEIYSGYTLTAKVYGPSGWMKKTAKLTLRPISVNSLSLKPTKVVGGSSTVVKGTVSLEATPDPSVWPNGINVSLTSSNPSVANPTTGSITIAAGQQIGTFTLNTFSVTTSTTVTITASANGLSKTAKLTVNP